MTYEIATHDFPLPAAGDLSALQFRAVTVDANGRAAQQTVAQAICAGVLQNKPGAIDRGASVRATGITKMVASGAIAPGTVVSSDAVGRAIAAAVGGYALGVALTSSANPGEIISVLLTHPGKS